MARAIAMTLHSYPKKRAHREQVLALANESGRRCPVRKRKQISLINGSRTVEAMVNA